MKNGFFPKKVFFCTNPFAFFAISMLRPVFFKIRVTMNTSRPLFSWNPFSGLNSRFKTHLPCGMRQRLSSILNVGFNAHISNAVRAFILVAGHTKRFCSYASVIHFPGLLPNRNPFRECHFPLNASAFCCRLLGSVGHCLTARCPQRESVVKKNSVSITTSINFESMPLYGFWACHSRHASLLPVETVLNMVASPLVIIYGFRFHKLTEGEAHVQLCKRNKMLRRKYKTHKALDERPGLVEHKQRASEFIRSASARIAAAEPGKSSSKAASSAARAPLTFASSVAVTGRSNTRPCFKVFISLSLGKLRPDFSPVVTKLRSRYLSACCFFNGNTPEYGRRFIQVGPIGYIRNGSANFFCKPRNQPSFLRNKCF